MLRDFSLDIVVSLELCVIGSPANPLRYAASVCFVCLAETLLISYVCQTKFVLEGIAFLAFVAKIWYAEN